MPFGSSVRRLVRNLDRKVVGLVVGPTQLTGNDSLGCGKASKARLSDGRWRPPAARRDRQGQGMHSGCAAVPIRARHHRRRGQKRPWCVVFCSLLASEEIASLASQSKKERPTDT